MNGLLTHDDSLDVGSSQIYKIQEGDNDLFSVPVNFNEHYEYCGVGLRHLNRVKYSCLVKVVKKKKEKEDENDNGDDTGTRMVTVEQSGGSKKSPIFDFGPGHPLQATHTQNLKSLQTIPIHTKTPPKLPTLTGNGVPENNIVAQSLQCIT